MLVDDDTVRRFWKYVRKTDSCWLWTGTKDPTGYGRLHRNRRAHRIAWVIHNGPIPRDLYVCHKCDVRLCVNPDHLFVGSNLDNRRDSVAKGRHAFGERQGCHKLTESDVREMRTLFASMTNTELARQFNVSRRAVRRVRTGEYWSWFK